MDSKRISYGEVSRNVETSPGNLTDERIQASALVRIADAVEIMTKDRVKLERDLDWDKRRYAERGKDIEARDFKIRALKGVITRLKNDREKVHQSGVMPKIEVIPEITISSIHE